MSPGQVLAALGVMLGLVSFGMVKLSLPLLGKAARLRGLVDTPGGRKAHAQAVPLVGGIAILAGVAVPAVGGLLAALLGEAGLLALPAALSTHLPGIRSRAPQLLAVLAGSGVMLLLGHADDRQGLSPWTRLAVEGACALALALVGIRVTLFLTNPWLQLLLTVAFVVFVTNAVNFLDNMNGLMGGVLLVASLHLLTLAVSSGQLFLAAILICLAGALLAFLQQNFPDGRIFSGDAGSLAIGFLLAATCVLFTYEEHGVSLRPVLVPLAILALPLADGCSVIVSRL